MKNFIIGILFFSILSLLSCSKSSYTEPSSAQQVLSLPKADCGGDPCL